MKIKLLLILFFLPLFIVANNEEIKFVDNDKLQKNKPPKKRRYRLDDKTKNYYHLGNGKIVVNVPITYNKLKIKRWIKNISSSESNINAVLIWIKTPNGEFTSCNGEISTKSKKFNISKLRGLKEQLNRSSDEKLVVAFWINETEPDYVIEESFRELIRTSGSYKDAVDKLNKYNCNEDNLINKSIFDYITRPAESGGDVIGGNG